jgi:hypothetical protein
MIEERITESWSWSHPRGHRAKGDSLPRGPWNECEEAGVQFMAAFRWIGRKTSLNE